MIEIEKTYLAKFIPNISNCKYKEIIDIYLPKNTDHPNLRLRKNGNYYEMTKKIMIDNDPSRHKEHNIELTEEEFLALSNIDGKKLRKIRYYYDYKDRIAEIDIFQDDLSGLVLVDFEFNETENINDFKMPDFCLTDMTTEDCIAGGILCGKSYKDIEGKLKEFGYTAISK